MLTKPALSVCIPAYNRFQFLSPLLDSIIKQNIENIEIVICEDYSPERVQIREICSQYIKDYPGLIKYIENDRNLGYDGNIRKLIEISNAKFCMFMGNDDLMCDNAIKKVMDIIAIEENCGVIIRSYATFDINHKKYNQIFRYFSKKVKISKGYNAISLAYRRGVVLPGLVINRDEAKKYSTNIFDGTLLYQIYLIGMILAKMDVVFTPEIIALRRDGNLPDFGNSEVEKNKFVPQKQTPESSFNFMKGMIDIAKHIEKETKISVYKRIERDIAIYSYPILAIQSDKSFLTFIKYWAALCRLGFYKYLLFHLYFILLIIVGRKLMDTLIIKTKIYFGHTPLIGVKKSL